MQQWVDKISKTIDTISSGGGGNNNNGGATNNGIVGGGENNSTKTEQTDVPRNEKVESPTTSPNQNGSPTIGTEIEKQTSTTTTATSNTKQPTDNDDDQSHLGKLIAAKNAIPFLCDEKSKVLEFWSIWSDSIPNADDMEGISEKIEFQLATSAKCQKLTWRACGPQNAFIQKMVDFFWNVGAPETEIDKLNDVGALINPSKIGSWIDMSEKGGMDGGWYFPVENTIKLALAAGDAGDPTELVAEWCTNNNVEQSFSVGRDMGAAPPRQTEIFLKLPGNDVNSQIELALDAFSTFQFPAIPEGALNVLREKSNVGICLSVITSAEGFVRLGILVPTPSTDCVNELCSIVNASSSEIHALESAVQVNGPTFVEYQHLTEGYGYGVYNEGFDVVFHYSLN